MLLLIIRGVIIYNYAQMVILTQGILLKLDQCRPQYPGKASVQERLSDVFTPLHLPQWESMLANYPDIRSYVEFILDGIRDSFQIDFSHSDGAEQPLSSARKNMKSADEHHQVVSDYLEAERCRRAVLGLFTKEEVPSVHLSRFGVIPKSHQLGG